MKRVITIICIIITSCNLIAKEIHLYSPDKSINVLIKLNENISYSVYYQNQLILNNCNIGIQIGDEVKGSNPRLIDIVNFENDKVLNPILPLKFATIQDRYNQFTFFFHGNYSIEFRAYNDGIAHRILTDLDEEVEVMNELFTVHFPQKYNAIMQQPRNFKTAYEEPYTKVETATWKTDDRMSVLPMLITTNQGVKILLSESDQFDFPGMFLKGTGENSMYAVFPRVPLEYEEEGDRSLKIIKEAPYIAKSNGKRSYPWRYFVIVDDDKKLLENTMSYKLATKNRLSDTSWIQPGQVSWEWWNGASVYGEDVEFVSGFNLDTYKYYIDFASEFGIPYIIMDEGWALNTYDPFTPNPLVDVLELIDYGNKKNVGIILWLTWLAVENNFELFEVFEKWGIKGVKIDFMDRSDQWMVNFYERVAKEAAKNHLFVDFHGSFKPAGMEYTYPNILSYEGVRGMEYMGRCTPDNSLFLPFIRNAVGAMDYTPGAMISMHPESYVSKYPNSASIGTRAYQLALFIIFESGLQMLADSPSLYYQNRECTDFITKVPTLWDETLVLEAKVGEYVIVAKRKDNNWFIGGITNNSEKERKFELAFDFLPENYTFSIKYVEDGINAAHQAMDYQMKKLTVTKNDKIEITMVRNGGWAAILEHCSF